MKKMTIPFFLLILALSSNTFATDRWRLELLQVAPSLRGLETALGNTALLLIPPGQLVESGTVWQCRKKAPEETPPDSIFSLLTWSNSLPLEVISESALTFFSRQIGYEFRNVDRYIVPTTIAQSEKLFLALTHLSTTDHSKSPRFRAEDCTTLWLKTLAAAGLSFNLKQLLSFVKTLDMFKSLLPNFLRQLLLTPIPVLTSYNLIAQVNDIQNKYNIQLKSVQKNNQYEEWSTAEESLFKKFEKHELVLAAQSLSIFDDKRLPFLRAMIFADKSESKPIFRIQNFPNSFYEICQTRLCANDLARDINNYYTAAERRSIKAMLTSEFNRSRQLNLSDINLLATPQAESWRLLIEALN